MNINIEGQETPIENLKIPKAKELAEYIELGVNPYVHIIECKKALSSKNEIIVFDADIEVSQYPVYNICKVERIVVEFDCEDNNIPKVFALRDDFPAVPHINIGVTEFPRNLCLYDEKYSELKLYWTAAGFIRRIREWFKQTAEGLHQIEPLLLPSQNNLILDPLIIDNKISKPEEIIYAEVVIDKNTVTFITEEIRQEKKTYNVIVPLKSPPQVNTIIKQTPLNLKELSIFVREAGIQLIPQLKVYLKNWITGKKVNLDSKIILLFSIPMKRREDGPIEANDQFAFLVNATIKEIGIKLGVYQEHKGKLGLILENNSSDEGQSFQVFILNPMPTFTREKAAEYNGLSERIDKKIGMIGLGAIGSQIYNNLVRSGTGEWILIDNDIFLPHNNARHILSGCFVGRNKAIGMSIYGNDIVNREKISRAINNDAVEVSVREEIEKVDIILDTSVSVALSRYLSIDLKSPARRISVFLNPSGNDSVILAEAEDREITLDNIEMQYYRYLSNNTELKDHLISFDNKMRYGGSCSDITNRIPQTMVSLHAAICAKGLQNLMTIKEGGIHIWNTNPQTYEVKKYSTGLSKIIKLNLGEWIINIDQWLLEKLHQARSNKLPKETGGILIGSYDMARKIVYVIDTVLSPPDSEEWPTVYIRGCKGLKEEIERISRITLGRLEYIGEWHSHPDRYSCEFSSDDLKVFCWLQELMLIDGHPALMMVIGENAGYKLAIGTIK
jgi:hypothetical protein